MNTRRCYSVLIAIALIAGRAAAAGEPQAGQSLERAAAYLWSQQAEDGGWHSPQYGVLKSGQALTPFVLYAQLLAIDAMSSDEAGRVLRAARFIESHLNEAGAVGCSDPQVTEYPVYSTAYALQCFQRAQTYRRLLNDDGDRAIQRMRRYLLDAQFDEADGFTEAHPAYGGWGFQAALEPGKSGHMDLAHTRQALEALRVDKTTSRDASTRPLSRKALVFLQLVQKDPQSASRQPPVDGAATSRTAPPFDGGFYFSPVVLEANKGRVEGGPAPHWRSYATATCDGILALLAAGVPRDDERVAAAIEWLRQRPDLDYPQGVPTDHPEPWGEAIRFYHYAVRAEVYRKLDFPPNERAALATAVAKLQRGDGSFVNVASPLMKEDDPVLCTALAVVAMANCRP